MHAEIEDLREQVPQWIPVSEWLPDVGGRAMILVDACEHEMAWRSEDGWNVPGKSTPTSRVTHWMPLPAPPTDGK
jgi:hypothetical protein